MIYIEQTEKTETGLDVAIKAEYGGVLAWAYTEETAQLIADALNVYDEWKAAKDTLEEIGTMKIPYCDANDVAHYMRDAAKDALPKEKDNE